MQPWSRRLARAGAVVAVALGVLVGAPSAANADVEDFSFDSLTVDYTLTRAEDGTSRMRVVEEFVARFPETDQNRGIRRVIPDEYDGQPLRPSLESAVDAEGDPWEVVETDDGEDGLVVTARSEDYVHGRPSRRPPPSRLLPRSPRSPRPVALCRLRQKVASRHPSAAIASSSRA